MKDLRDDERKQKNLFLLIGWQNATLNETRSQSFYRGSFHSTVSVGVPRYNI